MKKQYEPWRHRLFAYLEYRELPQELTIDEKTSCLHGEFVVSSTPKNNITPSILKSFMGKTKMSALDLVH